MTDDQEPSPTIESAVARFLSAEEALGDLRAEQTRLRDAADRFINTDEEMSRRTTTAIDALEEVRARLRQEILDVEEIRQSTNLLHKSFSEAVTETRLVLETLRTIDPAAMSRDLAELRRDGSDNATEVREVRRLTVDVQRAQDLIARTQDDLATSNRDMTANYNELQDNFVRLTAAHTSLVSDSQRAARQLRVLVPVAIVSLLLAVGTLIVTIAK